MNIFFMIVQHLIVTHLNLYRNTATDIPDESDSCDDSSVIDSQSDALDRDIENNEVLLSASACAVTEKWPEDWNEKQIEAFKTKYFWLDAKDGRLGCTECQYGLSKGLSIMKDQGIAVSNEWAKYLISPIDCEDRSKRLTSLRKKISKHLNSEAHTRILKLKKKSERKILPKAVDKHSITVDLETERIFRTAYHIAKMNRPFSDMTPIVELQKCNGLDMGIILHSRYSANQIISTIANEMNRRIVKSLVENNSKLSILIDESTTVSLKSVLVINLKASIDNTSSPIFIFLDLIELENQNAETITDTLLKCLKNVGFNEDYLKTNWIFFCIRWSKCNVREKIWSCYKNQGIISFNIFVALYEPQIRTGSE